jgi:aminopeptidase N
VTNHFTAGGGLNLRGYSGYLLARKNSDGTYSYDYRGATGASASIELEFGELFKWNPKFLHNSIKLMPYLFADAGTININKPGTPNVMSNVMADAGAGMALSIVKWWRLYNVKPLTIRFDVPFFINRLPFAEEDYVQFRWMLGVNRAF